jgi:ligand-binding sensor protein
MAAMLTDDKGEVLRTYGERFPLCAAIRAKESASTYVCGQTNTVMLQIARRSLEPVVDLCEAGLFRVVLPIIRNEDLVGQIAACGRAPDDEEFDPFLAAQALEVSEDEILELFKDTPPCSEDEIEAVAQRLFREIGQ